MNEPGEMSRKRAIWILFFEFLKIATFVVGGGFAILVVAEDVFSKRHKWLREGELSDMLAIIQTEWRCRRFWSSQLSRWASG